jgi:hypothetical protein
MRKGTGKEEMKVFVGDFDLRFPAKNMKILFKFRKTVRNEICGL